MKKCVLTIFRGHCWCIGEVHIDGRLVGKINLFYEVTPEWIYIFDADGGQGTGYRKGCLEQKIYIGDCEFEKVLKNPEPCRG